MTPFNKTFIRVFAVSLALLSAGAVVAWTGNSNPPSNNTAPPINTSSTAQAKTGDLTTTVLNVTTKLDAGASGTICLGGVCNSAWPSGSNFWTAVTGGINYAGGTVGIGATGVRLATGWGASSDALTLRQNSWNGVTNTYAGFAADHGYFYGGLQSGGNSGSEAGPGQLYVSGTSALLGNVGIGTQTPAFPLTIKASNTGLFMDSTSPTSDVFMSMGVNPSTGPAFNFGYAGASYGRGAGFINVRPDASATAPNPSLRISTANVQAMIIDNNQQVGIGTSNPAAKLDVQGGNINTSGSVTAADATFGGSLVCTQGNGRCAAGPGGGVTSITAGSGITINQSTGDVTVSAVPGGAPDWSTITNKPYPVNPGTTWNWNGFGGQPTWLWGSNSSDGSQMYVWNPTNFSVANSAALGGVAASGFCQTNGTNCPAAGPGGDNLGNHTATAQLNLAGNNISNVNILGAAAANISGLLSVGSLTASGNINAAGGSVTAATLTVGTSATVAGSAVCTHDNGQCTPSAGTLPGSTLNQYVGHVTTDLGRHVFCVLSGYYASVSQAQWFQVYQLDGPDSNGRVAWRMVNWSGDFDKYVYCLD